MTPHDAPAPGYPPPATLRRPDGRLQLGVGPGSVLVAEGSEDPLAHRLGTALAAHRAAAGELRCPVLGHGRLAARLAGLLGHVDPSARDVPLVVLVHQHVVPPETGVAAAQDHRLTLPVVVQTRRVVVGPLTGRPSSACLHCLDLHRRDRDPAWPDLAAWLGHPVHQVDPPPLAPEVLAAAEGLVLLLVASTLAGRPASPGLAHEVGPQAPHVVSRRWARHPRCPWHAGAAAGHP